MKLEGGAKKKYFTVAEIRPNVKTSLPVCGLELFFASVSFLAGRHDECLHLGSQGWPGRSPQIKRFRLNQHARRPLFHHPSALAATEKLSDGAHTYAR
jgi:hypothetical protein